MLKAGIRTKHLEKSLYFPQWKKSSSGKQIREILRAKYGCHFSGIFLKS